MTYHWILQDNLYGEEGYPEVIETLNRFKISYEIVHIENGRFYPDINPISNDIMICGTYSLAKLAKEKGWSPGTFMNENHSFDKWLKHYNMNMLNADSEVLQLKDVASWIKGNAFFMRPLEDGKTFAGTTFNNKEEFLEWKEYRLSLMKSLTEDAVVVVSGLKKIFREFRLFIIDNQIVSGSLYKQSGMMMQSPILDQGAVEFAREMIDIWTPARAFVLDIAQTDLGYKIIEINCINCAGFYASDVQRIILTMDQMNE